jgi:CP family cyanate transporter-like MFS transporter
LSAFGCNAAVAERPRIALAWLATVVLVTLNLRPFLTAIGPLTPTIQAHTGLGLQALAWLTLLPMALMGAGTWLAPALLPRLGARPTLALALTLLALGCALRLVPALAAGHRRCAAWAWRWYRARCRA